MKTKLTISALLTIGYFYLSSVVSSVGTTVQNKISVATVNGGDAEFVAQTAYNSFPFWLSTVAYLVILVAIWWGTIKKVFDGNIEKDKK